jgi:transposase
VDADDIEHRVKGQIKKKTAALAESLFGTLTEHQILLIRGCWKHITFLEQSIQELDQQIQLLMKPHQSELELVQTVPGVSDVTAACIIAEIGTDMGQFPTADHLASWAGVAPGNHESAGQKKVLGR